MRPAVFFALALSLVACQKQGEPSYVEVKNPFLVAAVESFRLAARDAMVKKDISGLANQVFLFKRTLPMAWAAVVDSSGTVLMHSEPPMITTKPTDPVSLQSPKWKQAVAQGQASGAL